MILAIRTDAPQAELYLTDDAGRVLHQHSWLAGRELAARLLTVIESFLSEHKVAFADLTGIGVYSGSGSFTGLRIGTSVANALAYSLGIKVAKASGEDWLDQLAGLIKETQLGHYVSPDYDRAPNITKPTQTP